MRIPSYPRRTALGAALAATAALLLLAPAAQAAGAAGGGGNGSGGSGDGGWHSYHGQDTDDPAGTVCPFHLHIASLVDQEETKTVSRYPDGSPEKVLWRGPLILRYTNVDTGAHVDRDQSGRGTQYLLPDGGTLWVLPKSSHMSARIRPGNPYHAAGDYLFSGGVVLLVHADKQVQVLAQHQVENLCDTLG
ncbi:hypothetical protein [Kitasatospora viridis]|uniref:Uncharacterized protein n=1 Tax=Kitasatospora viridis TaxID=281105 RepID=A0A561TTA5_9ACTN|nr:hypothetical protein [Kitasatospora viridis]TWF90330.1 hypothetical protein FHX73_13374 [Kitasatospora viridis]